MNPEFKVASVQVVSSFEVDAGIVMTCGPVLRDLERRLKGQLTLLNTPAAAPPPLARAILEVQDAVLQIALDRFQLMLRPPAHIASELPLILDFTLNSVSSLFSDLTSIMPVYLWSGIIIDIEYAYKDAGFTDLSQVNGPVFNRLISINPKERNIATLDLNFGFEDNGYFVNYRLSTYETRNTGGKIFQPGVHHKIKREEYKLNDIGIAALVDINNLPSESIEGRHPITDLTMITKKINEVVPTLLKDLNLEGVL